jgi:hypothetical protein
LKAVVAVRPVGRLCGQLVESYPALAVVAMQKGLL